MKYLIESDELRYGGLLGALSEIQMDEFPVRIIWQEAHHLYHYTIKENQEHPYCDWGKMQRDIKKAVSEGYLTRSGRTSASRYVKTEKLMSTEFAGFAIMSNH